MQKIIQDRKYFRSTTPSPQLFNQYLVNGHLVQYLIVLLSNRGIKGSVLGGKYLNVYCFSDFYHLFSDSSYYICLSFVDFLWFFYVDITINLFPCMLILIRKHLKKTSMLFISRECSINVQVHVTTVCVCVFQDGVHFNC